MTVEEVIEQVWQRYEANMAAGRMRQRPGRTEYQIELQKAGLLPKGEDAARKFFFDFTSSSKIAKTIRKVERRHRQA